MVLNALQWASLCPISAISWEIASIRASRRIQSSWRSRMMCLIPG